MQVTQSVTKVARRAQIVSATVQVLAEVGFGQTTFARIAERAGLSSTRLISYHFTGKQDLIDAVVADVYASIAGFMAEKMNGIDQPAAALRQYISSLVGFIAANGTRMQALMTIFLGAHEGSSTYSDNDALQPLMQILVAGQKVGDFRVFDPFVMAATIQRSIDGLPFLLRDRPHLDLTGYGQELVTMFDNATKKS